MNYKAGDKLVIEIKKVSDECKGMYEAVNGYTFTESVLDDFDRLDGDYINEYFGDLQDEAFSEGRSRGVEEGIKWCAGNEEDAYKNGFNDAVLILEKLLLVKDTTGKGMDIITIMEELRKE